MVGKIFSTGKSILLRKEENILSAGFIVGITLFASAILGLIRDRLLAHFFGAEPYFSQLGLYYAADRIPSFIFSIIVIGTLSTAFIPVFTKRIRQDENEGWKLASITLNAILLIFSLLGIFVFCFAKEISNLVTLQSLDKQNILIMAKLLRIMIVAQLILVVSSFFTSLLQSFQRFLIPALSPVLYNVGIIFFILIFSKNMGVFAPAWGMVFGAFLHLSIQAALSRNIGFTYRLTFNFNEKGLKEIISLMLPRVASLTANQISLLVDTSLAVLLGSSYVVVFNFAQHLQTVPVNFFGAAIAQAAFPVLSRLSDRKDDFFEIFASSFKQIAFFTLPASILFIILRIPLVRLVFGAARFSWHATIATSYTLAFFSISIAFQALIYLLNRAFYSFHDTKTPVKLSVISIALNIVLAIAFILYLKLGIWSLSLAFSISSFINFLLLYIFLGRRLPNLYDLEFLDNLAKIGWASLLTGFFLYIPMRLLDDLVFDTTRTLNLIVLTIIVFLCGFTAYIILSKLLDIKERLIVVSLIKKCFNKIL